MEFTVCSDIAAARGLPGRLRLKCLTGLSPARAAGVEAALTGLSCVTEARASHLTGNIVIGYEAGHREDVLAAVNALSPPKTKCGQTDMAFYELRGQLGAMLFSHVLVHMFFPRWLLVPIDILESIGRLRQVSEEQARRVRPGWDEVYGAARAAVTVISPADGGCKFE